MTEIAGTWPCAAVVDDVGNVAAVDVGTPVCAAAAAVAAAEGDDDRDEGGVLGLICMRGASGGGAAPGKAGAAPMDASESPVSSTFAAAATLENAVWG